MLRLLLGTRQVIFNDHGIHFDIHGCAKINRVQINYDAGMDLYKIKFLHVSGCKASLNLVAEYNDIYADQLCGMIESETGLFLGPFRIRDDEAMCTSLARNFVAVLKIFLSGE